VIYPDAPHGFHADYRPPIAPKRRPMAGKRLLEWFRSNGVFEPGHRVARTSP